MFHGVHKITCKYEQKYFERPNSPVPSPVLSACHQKTTLQGLPESSGGQISSLPLSTSFNRGSPCSYITWGMMNNRPAGNRSTETQSHPHRQDKEGKIMRLTETDDVLLVTFIALCTLCKSKYFSENEDRSVRKICSYWSEDRCSISSKSDTMYKPVSNLIN